MDNVCHTLVGAAISEAGLKHKTRFGTATLLIAANLPDVDALVFFTDTLPVSFRRGWTHGIAAQILLPVLLTGALWAVGRARARDSGAAVRVGWLLALSYVGIYSHVFLDYLNNYGIRLLAPLDWRWFYGDAVFIVDPWLWLVLGTGVWFARRREATRAPRYALVLAALYIAAMLTAARVARTTVIAAWMDAHGSEPRAVMVGPVLANPFAREVIVDAGDRYEWGRLSRLGPVDFSPDPVPKNDWRTEVTLAREAPNIRAFLVWSRFPAWTLTPAEGGTRVTVSDARFMSRGAIFSASTIVAHRKDEGSQ